jgi:hypothetical protein
VFEKVGASSGGFKNHSACASMIVNLKNIVKRKGGRPGVDHLPRPVADGKKAPQILDKTR